MASNSTTKMLSPGGHPAQSSVDTVNVTSLSNTVLGLGISLVVISSILVVLRLGTNLKHVGKLAVDDYLCVFGQLGGIAIWATTYSLIPGLSTRTVDHPIGLVTPHMVKSVFIQQILYPPSLFATKAAILALYIRIFGSTAWLRRTCYSLIAFASALYTASIVVAAVYCTPRPGGAWDGGVVARCGSPTTTAIVVGTLTVALDVLLFVLPFPVIRTLKLGRRRNVGLCVPFAVGLLTIVTSFVSLYYRIKVFQGANLNVAWNGMNALIATFTEIFGTAMVSCAPALSAFWTHYFTKSALYLRLRSAIFAARTRTTRTGMARYANRKTSTGSTTYLRPYHYPNTRENDSFFYSNLSQSQLELPRFLDATYVLMERVMGKAVLVNHGS